MKYGSVCSGIEAATAAWHPLGWDAEFYSEIEPFPCAVLAHHYPSVPNLGDMTKFKEWPDAALDVLVGGTPCQSFSVAGLRKGLDDPRGNLMLTFGSIAAKYRPRTTQITSKTNRSNPQPGDPCHTLSRGAAAPLIAWSEELTASTDCAGTIQRGGNGGRHEGVMTPSMQVRRLTPMECERLQGFPDDYTLIPYRNKPAADGTRYKALGNSMAVPVMKWIGERIQMVDNINKIESAA